VAAPYQVVIKDRTNELTLYDFAANDMVTAFSFKNQRRGGCISATFTLAAASWAAVESYFAKFNIVEISLDFGSGMTLVWSGRLIRYDLPKNTAPKDNVRKFECRGFWSDLKPPGCKVLKVYDSLTVKAIVEALIADPISDETGVSSSTAEVETGLAYTPEWAIFEDIDAAKCLEKCAELYGDVVCGVDENRRVYFRDEVGEGAAAVLTFQLGQKTSAVKMFDRKVDATKCVNYFIIEGREAKTGSPMTVVKYDPALDSDGTLPTRMKKVKAPELVKGAELMEWGTYLLARDKDPKVTAKLSVPKLDGKLSTPLLVEDLNRNLTVYDTGMALIGKYQVQGITYTLNGGSIAATFEIGNDLFRDEVDALGLRELLREIAASEAKEFVSFREVGSAFDGWKDTAYYHLAGTHGMRNTFIVDDITDGGYSLIDFDHENTQALVKDTGGITTSRGGTVGGRFVTIPIAFGYDGYTEFSFLANLGARCFLDSEGGHDDLNLYFHSLGMGSSTSDYNLSWEPDDEYTYPWYRKGTNPYNFYSAMILNRGVAWQTDIELRFRWGVPVGASGVIRRHFYFRCCNEDNCYVVRMFGDPPASVLKFEVWRFVSGVQTALTGFGSTSLPISDHDEVTLKIDQTTYLNEIGVTLTNEETSVVRGGFSDAGQGTYHRGQKGVGFGLWARSQAGPGRDEWGIKHLRFSNAIYRTDTGQLSRDGGYTWEPSGADVFNIRTGNKIDLGVYSGGGTLTDEILFQCEVASPTIIKGLAIGCK